MTKATVKSAERVFDLLELFESEQRPLRVVDISRRLEIPQSSVSMLIKTLVSKGYMDFDPVLHEYCPSVRVSFLGDWTTRMPDRHDAVRDAMRQLASETGESVFLGRRSGMMLQYLSVVDSKHALRFSLPPGTLRPLHRTAIGIMILSELDDEKVRLLLRRYNAEAPSGPHPANIPWTLRAIASARDRGYYESANLATPGAGVIAALLPTLIRRQRLCIGVGAPVARLHDQRARLLSALSAIAKTC